MDKLRENTITALRYAGAPPEIVYAYERTGILAVCAMFGLRPTWTSGMMPSRSTARRTRPDGAAAVRIVYLRSTFSGSDASRPLSLTATCPCSIAFSIPTPAPIAS